MNGAAQAHRSFAPGHAVQVMQTLGMPREAILHSRKRTRCVEQGTGEQTGQEVGSTMWHDANPGWVIITHCVGDYHPLCNTPSPLSSLWMTNAVR